MDAKLLIDWNLILNIIILGLSNLIDTYESIDLVFYLGHVWGVYGVRIFTPTDNCIKTYETFSRSSGNSAKIY